MTDKSTMIMILIGLKNISEPSLDQELHICRLSQRMFKNLVCLILHLCWTYKIWSIIYEHMLWYHTSDIE